MGSQKTKLRLIIKDNAQGSISISAKGQVAPRDIPTAIDYLKHTILVLQNELVLALSEMGVRTEGTEE